jgi:tetratricopeptide (TPR) repeat protein
VEAAPATTKAPAQATPAAKSRVEPQPVGKALAVLGTGLLLAGSALLGGALLGFLFGIPRSLQQQGAVEAPPAEGASASGQGASGRSAYGANTSLEQISDWLTKILVGVGLTQLSSLPSSLTQFADFAIPGLGGFETSGVFAVALLIYFVTCGFLMSYLWTRLKLGKAFGEADALAAIRGEIETAVVSELQKKAQGQLAIDYEALQLTEKQLESGDVPQAELDKAFRGTSDIYRTHIYQLASKARSDNWREPEKKKKMERTIPIFRALIATDAKPEKERYHQNYAQLGFALAEAAPPDYPNAIAALDKAIDLRGSPETHGYLWNEFVRAKCLADPKSHDPETKERVLKDLRVALKLWPDLAGVVRDDERLSAWMKANHVSLKSLLSQDT